MQHATAHDEHQPIPTLVPPQVINQADADQRLPEWALRHIASFGDGCWTWTGPRQQRYGGGGGDRACAPANGNAARAIWIHIHGAMPAGFVTRHTCDNAMCVRPSHLLIGTPHANSQDAVRRGRLRPCGRPARADLVRPAQAPRRDSRVGTECSHERCGAIAKAEDMPVPLCPHHLRKTFEYVQDLLSMQDHAAR